MINSRQAHVDIPSEVKNPWPNLTQLYEIDNLEEFWHLLWLTLMPLMFVFECVDDMGFGLLKSLFFGHVANNSTRLLDNVAAPLFLICDCRSDMNIGVHILSKLETIIIYIAFNCAMLFASLFHCWRKNGMFVGLYFGRKDNYETNLINLIIIDINELFWNNWGKLQAKKS